MKKYNITYQGRIIDTIRADDISQAYSMLAQDINITLSTKGDL